METENKTMALLNALKHSGLYPGPAVYYFLLRKGYTLDDVMRRGGWRPILVSMISDGKQTIEEIIESISTFSD